MPKPDNSQKSTPSKKKGAAGNTASSPADKGHVSHSEFKGTGKLMELLGMVKSECEVLTSESTSLRKERDELKKLLDAQVAQAEAMKEALTSLKKKHDTLKGRYEEEFQRLRSQESKGGLQSGIFGNGNGPSFSYQGGTQDGEPATKRQKSEGNVLSPLENGGMVAAGGAAAEPRASPPAPGGGIESGTVVKKDGYLLVYNPLVETRFNVDLRATVEHQSVVCCVRFSNNGKYLASGCNKSAQIFETQKGQSVANFPVVAANASDDSYVRSVCFSPDSTRLVAGAEDRTIKVWSIDKKNLLHTLTGHQLDIYSLDYSSDGRHIISGSGDRTVRLWDAETGRSRHTLTAPPVQGLDGGVTSISFSPDGSMIAAGSLDRLVRVWDTESGNLLHQLEGHQDSVYSVAFAPDGKSLITGSLDRTLRLWDVNRSGGAGKCSSVFTGHKDFVLSVAYSPNGKWIVSGSKDRTVQFWDPRSAITSVLLQGHSNSVFSVAVAPQGNLIGTGSGDCQARIWSYDESGPVVAKK